MIMLSRSGKSRFYQVVSAVFVAQLLDEELTSMVVTQDEIQALRELVLVRAAKLSSCQAR